VRVTLISAAGQGVATCGKTRHETGSVPYQLYKFQERFLGGAAAKQNPENGSAIK